MKYYVFIFTFLTSGFFSVNSFSQVNQVWTSSFNSSSNDDDEVQAMAVDNSGNVFVTGFTITKGQGKDFITIKYNSSGVLQWSKTYNNSVINGDDEATSIAVDALGNSFVTGYSTGDTTFKDYLTIKYSALGEELWTADYNGTGNDDDISVAIKTGALGNIYITGLSVGKGTSEDYVTINYNSAGVEQWVARYNNDLVDDIDIARALTLDINGNVIVTGFSYGLTKNEDYTTVKYNSGGTEQWVVRYNNPSDNYDIPNSVGVDNSGNIFVTGFSFGENNNEDYATVKYNTDGAEQWVARYNGSSNNFDIATSLTVDNNGNVIVTGYSYDDVSSEDYATIKYNTNGEQQWISFYNGDGNDFDITTAVKSDVSGNIYVTGSSYSSNTVEDFATVKYNSAGVQQWVETYDGVAGGSDIVTALNVDISGNVYTSGYTFESSGDFDCVTIKYAQTVGINQISNSIPGNFELKQNYPNPFNPETKINYELPSSRQGGQITNYVFLKVFDLAGKEVAALVNEKQNAGSYSVTFDASNLSSGIYFYTLQTGDFVQTKKMTLLK